ncbi:MAG: formylglycine-generating enzyme family protein, partial [Blastocatellia bacterium]
MSKKEVSLDPVEEGKQLVDQFLQLADDEEGYRRLACHAALPLILTTEMVGFLRHQYVRHLSWVAEVDLLLSRLCVDTGEDLYVMNSEARAALLQMMQEDPDLGSRRIEEVNRLLIDRLSHLVEKHPALIATEMEAFRFSAMLCVTERRDSAVEQLAARIVEQLEGPTGVSADTQPGTSRSRLRQLTGIVTEHASLLEDERYRDLVDLATITGQLLDDHDGRLVAELSDAGRLEDEYRVPGVDKPIRLRHTIDRLYPGRKLTAGDARDGADWLILSPTPVVRRVIVSDGTEIRFEMVDLPGGEFLMGGTRFDDEKPVHRVRVAPFSIGKYEVTQAEWRAVMGKNPSRFKGDRNPVERVLWEDVEEFLKRIGNGFRLPTEAEWEYAARAGTTTEYSFGDDESQLGEY